MKIHLSPRVFEFSFPQLDTQVRVEESDNQVLIRATRDTFSEQRKLSFLRELAAEGFIRDELRWFSDQRLRSEPGLRWVIDYSWLPQSPRWIARHRRLLVGSVGFAVLCWLGLMAFLLWKSTH